MLSRLVVGVPWASFPLARAGFAAKGWKSAREPRSTYQDEDCKDRRLGPLKSMSRISGFVGSEISC